MSGTDAAGAGAGAGAGADLGDRTIRVLIADDQPLVRRGLSLILGPAPAITVVAEAENGERALALAREYRPDVVVMDIRMPVLDGVAATERLAHDLPECRVLALSTFDMDEYVVAAVRAGAYGFLPKDSSPEELVAAIRTVRAGEAAVAPRLLTRLISAYVRTGQPAPPGRRWPGGGSTTVSLHVGSRSGACLPPVWTTTRSGIPWRSASPPSRTTSPASSTNWAFVTGRRPSSRPTSRGW